MTKAGSTKLKARKNMAEMLLFQTAKWPELDDDDDADDADDGDGDGDGMACLPVVVVASAASVWQ